MKVRRCEKNPLIVPADVTPSRPEFKVDGIFNCGVAKLGEEIILLCRVAESVNDPADKNKSVNLTSLSHLRIARSKDGINFTVDKAPAILPIAEEERWGMEDPRITKIGDVYYINYTSVTENGPATSLISTKDFVNFERHGIIFAPENKDVAIFPEKINGEYVAFNRPVPFLTDKGWISIYHAADKGNRYCLGAFLLDKDGPFKVLDKTKDPIMEQRMTKSAGLILRLKRFCRNGCVRSTDTLIDVIRRKYSRPLSQNEYPDDIIMQIADGSLLLYEKKKSNYGRYCKSYGTFSQCNISCPK